MTNTSNDATTATVNAAPDGEVRTGRVGWRRPWVPRMVFVVLLLLLDIPVYRPALNRFFVEGQIYYFAELNNDTSLSAGLHFLDYNVVRKYNREDQVLYRPVLFLLLAVENALFDHDYHAWNVVSLCLHLTVAYLLFELLWNIQPTIFAPALALLFSVLTTEVELVDANGLGGYLLGFALLLFALLAARRLTAGAGRLELPWLGAYALTLLAGMLCYELDVVAAVLLAGYFWHMWRMRRFAQSRPILSLVAVISPLVVYGALYAIHFAHTDRLFYVGPQEASPFSEFFPLRVLQTLEMWMARVIDCQYIPLYFAPFGRFGWVKDNLIRGPALHMTLLAVGLFWCIRSGFTRQHLKANAAFAAPLLVIILAYAVITNLGRSYAITVSYYAYFFALIGFVLIYTLVDFSRVGRRMRLAALAVLALFLVLNADFSYKINAAVHYVNAPVDAYFDMIDGFVHQHRNEDGFAFAIGSPGADLDDSVSVWWGYPDQKAFGTYSISNLLYPKYFDATLLTAAHSDSAHHRYLLSWTRDLPK